MNQRGSFNTMRQLLRGECSPEKCDFCSGPLPPQHEHLLDPDNRDLTCVCGPCAVLFSSQGQTRYRRMQRRLLFLPEFQLTDAQWESLGIPINLAFFFHSSTENRVMAFYPSPAGPTESLLGLKAWKDIARANPVLDGIQPDIEALLINRLGTARTYFLAPIEDCYKLVGLIRTHWRGLSGGRKVWEEIEAFFADLARRAKGRIPLPDLSFAVEKAEIMPYAESPPKPGRPIRSLP